MYSLYIDGVKAWDPFDSDILNLITQPEVELEAGQNGRLKFTMQPGHELYNSIRKMVTQVEVRSGTDVIFFGRVINFSVDMYKAKEIECEGPLGYFNDSVQNPTSITKTAKQALIDAVNHHNEQVDDWKKIQIGNVTYERLDEQIELSDDGFAQTLGYIRSAVVDNFGGYFEVRRAGGQLYLDYYDAYTNHNPQVFEVGVNVSDLTIASDGNNIFSIVIPVGKNGLNIAEVNDGSMQLIASQEALSRYGRIVKVLNYGDIDSPYRLKDKAEYFINTRFALDPRSVTVTAIDGHLIDNSAPTIRIGDMVRVISPLHELDEELMVSKMTLKLDAPETSQYVLGSYKDPSEIADQSLTANLARVELLSAVESKNIEWNSEQVTIASNEIQVQARNILSLIAGGKVEIGGNQIYIGGAENTAAKIIKLNADVVRVTNMLSVREIAAQLANIGQLTIHGDIIADKITVNGSVEFNGDFNANGKVVFGEGSGIVLPPGSVIGDYGEVASQLWVKQYIEGLGLAMGTPSTAVVATPNGGTRTIHYLSPYHVNP